MFIYRPIAISCLSLYFDEELQNIETVPINYDAVAKVHPSWFQERICARQPGLFEETKLNYEEYTDMFTEDPFCDQIISAGEELMETEGMDSIDGKKV